MRNSLKLLSALVALGGAGLYGCVSSDPPAIDMKETEAVVSRQTDQDEVLYDFGKLIRAYTGKSATHPYYLQIKPITNDTGGGAGLPSDITRMVSTTIDKIGAPMVNVPYDPQYLSNEIGLRGGIRLGNKMPDIVIAGAITEFDKDLATKGTSQQLDLSVPLGQSSADASAEKRSDAQESRMTIDFGVLSYVTQTSTGAHTSNTVSVRKENKTSGWAFSIFGTGFGMTGNASRSQGVHAAIRSLVEVSVVQLLGREFRVPYWRMLKGAEPDRLLIRTIKEDIDAAGSEVIADMILGANGYFQDTYPRDSAKAVGAINKVFASAKIDYNATSLATIPTQALLDAWIQMPITDNMARHYEIAKRVASAPAPKEPVASKAAAVQAPLRLNVSTSQGQYKAGESMVVTLDLSNGAHVYCFWDQGGKTVSRILPNRFRTESLVKSRRFAIPSGDMRFRIQVEHPGSADTVACFASQEDLADRLPSAVKSVDLEAIEGYTLDKIRSLFAATDAGVAEGQVKIQVK
ncbi:MAG: DUF4384 domain-containing protein [Magnetococcales bacterium]|nr:DUF4384 domain-containing protein [Magnetococcales bacterium]MBF0322256.1 DUF4384 domain-containing protein [Magnetococcales bacterium]